MTKLYKIEILLSLAVEANDAHEARLELRKLYEATLDALPVGAGCFMKDAEWAQRTRLLLDVLTGCIVRGEPS